MSEYKVRKYEFLFFGWLTITTLIVYAVVFSVSYFLDPHNIEAMNLPSNADSISIPIFLLIFVGGFFVICNVLVHLLLALILAFRSKMQRIDLLEAIPRRNWSTVNLVCVLLWLS